MTPAAWSLTTWGVVLGIVASIAGIVGWLWRLVIRIRTLKGDGD